MRGGSIPKVHIDAPVCWVTATLGPRAAVLLCIRLFMRRKVPEATKMAPPTPPPLPPASFWYMCTLSMVRVPPPQSITAPPRQFPPQVPALALPLVRSRPSITTVPLVLMQKRRRPFCPSRIAPLGFSARTVMSLLMDRKFGLCPLVYVPSASTISLPSGAESSTVCRLSPGAAKYSIVGDGDGSLGVGNALGVAVGSGVGGVVGVDVGTLVGVSVLGSSDGCAVGTFVGADVGDVGTCVGVDVGRFVAVVGSRDGIDVGVDVGTFVGADVGDVVYVIPSPVVGQLAICTTPHDVGAHKGWASYIWRPPQQAEERPTPHSSQSKRHLFAQENQRIGIGGLVASCHQPGMLRLVGKL